MFQLITLFTLTFGVSHTLIPVLHKTYSYGKTPSSFGLIKGNTEPIGPYSFAVGDPENNIYIPDPVNGNIKIVSSTTGYINKIIHFTGYFDDIRVDKDGRIYLLDRTGQRIIQLDGSGKTVNEYQLDYKTVKNPCKLTLKNADIYIKNLLSASLYDLKTKSSIPSPYEAGIHKNRLDIFYHKPDGTIMQIASVEINGIVSAEILGTDIKENIYVQIEVKKRDEGVHLKVLKFRSSGKLIGEYTIPENDYFVWTARLLDIDDEGNIYQVLPKENYLVINVWKTE